MKEPDQGRGMDQYALSASNTHTELLLNKLKTLESRKRFSILMCRIFRQSLLLLKERIAVPYRRGNTGATSAVRANNELEA